MDADVYEILKNLDKGKKQELLSDILNRIQLSGQGSNFQNQNVEGYGYGGRIGYRQPIGDDALTLGVTGNRFEAKTPYGIFGGGGISGGDINYDFGNNRLSMKYDKNGALGGVPLKDLLQLIYQKRF